MTRDRDFKALVRRMAATEENYTAARTAMLNESSDAQRMSAAEWQQYERTVRAFFDGRRLTAIPSKRRARVIILLELLKRFEPGRRYSEREVSTILRRPTTTTPTCGANWSTTATSAATPTPSG